MPNQSPRLHIVHVAEQVDSAVCALARQLGARGYRQTLLSLSPRDPQGDEARAAGMEVVVEPSRARILAELERADIVRIEWRNGPNLGALLRSPLPAMRLMTVVHVAGDRFPNLVTAGLVEFSDRVVAGSPYTRDHGLLGALPVELRERKLACVRATPDFTGLEAVRRSEPEDRFTVGYLGPLDPRNLDPAIIDISGAVQVPGIRFVLRGPGDASHLHERIAALGLADRFDLGGDEQDGVAAILAGCDVFGSPLGSARDLDADAAVQAAMHAGVVPVVLARGGLHDLVLDHFTGLVVETSQAYARALEYLDQHPDERARMSHNARTMAAQLLSPVRAADQFERLYADMMQTAKRARTWTWDLAALRDPASASERLLDALAIAAPAFVTSMRSSQLEAVIEAEAEIAGMQAGAEVIHDHARAAPDDGYLQLWSGLIHERAGDLEAAASAFEQAALAGLRHFRIRFYRARVDEQRGRFEQARASIDEVLDRALNFEPAQALLRRLARGRRHPPIIALFSYPRSGNTWLRYVIEVLTGRPSVVPPHIVNNRPIAERFPELGIDPEAEPAVMKCHRLDDLPDGEHHLVVVVRDYSECIVRHRHDEPDSEFGFEDELPRYLEPLLYYHQFTGPKLLLYYEDLIAAPERSMAAVSEFLGLAQTPLREFMANYDAHFQRSVGAYSPGSHTGGRAKHHHGSRLSPETWTRWRAAIEAAAPQIRALYLARYD